MLEDKILKGLEDIGYSGPLCKYSDLHDACEIGPKDKSYTKLVQFLSNEIRILLSIDEEVNEITSPEDSVAFVMEVTSFLKELNCPYKCLTHGLVSERLQNYAEKVLLVDYLVTELMGARMLQDRKPDKKIELKLQETPEGADMRLILQTLRFPKPPPNITVKQLFDKLVTTIPLALKKAGADLIGKGIFNGFLSDEQWGILKGVQSDLNNEYKIRREMMLTRLDVTIQSFQWSNRTQGKEAVFEKIYHDNRKLLHTQPGVDISDLIAARTDIAVIEKTSNASVRKNTKTPLNKVIIGQVPDRGGRSWEQAPPPPEMPSWQQNRSTVGGAPTRGGGSGRGGPPRGNSGYRGEGRGRGGYSARGDFDSQRRYGGNSSFESRGHNPISTRGGHNYYDNRGGHTSYDNFASRGGHDNYSYNRRDSGGYAGQDFQQSKRPKTYDNFQAIKTTYADQYVQDNQHNQQYQRGGRGGYSRGRSTYHRGSGSSYR
ncbi:protein FAM98A-like [Dendroctonus ponderosae]|nr:protein FAM98A [Dendroctonus ponderosae]XP_048519189.1 protein FAM98A-like [Dendroctonus ponderosae]KAH1000056.1 hypothetical protein HUJ05_009480 [Dendroctonus ponderosae]KAH1000061.1 hypothetical protein HUJ05_012242 [Dendroctonus ponderosae]